MRQPRPVRIKPKQSLGQNFLVDENIVRNIVRDLKLAEDDAVVEIGPGLGALTRELVRHVSRLDIVEIDARAVEELRTEFSEPDVTILHEDILEVSLAGLARRRGRKLRVVGNIPYHLTSPILFKVFEERDSVADLTFMIQREVARRILAEPGTKENGILSILTRFYGEPKMLFTVSRNCFYPKPDVTSAVVRVRLFDAPPYPVGAAAFATLVKTAFGKRRKMLRNSLLYLPYEEGIIQALLSGNGELMDRRPEQLGVREFVTLAQAIERLQ
jgi:16S rRNA (adenine1518-N6/adenine1519-N6)-dimethyltransferase